MEITRQRGETAERDRDGVELNLLDLCVRKCLALVQVDDIVGPMHAQRRRLFQEVASIAAKRKKGMKRAFVSSGKIAVQ